MPKLIVTFKDMFLVANGNLRGGSVLLPSAEHELTIDTSGYQPPIKPLTRIEVAFDDTKADKIDYCIDRQNRHSRPDGAQLVRLEDVFAKPAVNVHFDYLCRTPVPAALNARVLVPEGRVMPQDPHKFPEVKSVRWRVGERQNQQLTDVAVFERDVDEAPIMRVSFLQGSQWSTQTYTLLPDGDDNFQVTFRNQDKMCVRAEVEKIEEWTLDQFGLLFKLTDLAKLSDKDRAKGHPQGRFKLPKTDEDDDVDGLSECRPICGAAQCDPEPPDPNDPPLAPESSQGGATPPSAAPAAGPGSR